MAPLFRRGADEPQLGGSVPRDDWGAIQLSEVNPTQPGGARSFGYVGNLLHKRHGRHLAFISPDDRCNQKEPTLSKQVQKNHSRK